MHRLHRLELDALPDDAARFRRLVELNVQEQYLNIMKLSFVQQARAEGEYPRIRGWVYDMSHGIVRDMHIDMSNFTEELAPFRVD